MSLEQHDDPFEERLSGALRQTGGAFGADPAELVAAGAARGRRIRLRRRAALVGAVAGVAAVAVSGALLLPSDGGAAERRTSVAATRSTEPSPEPDSAPASASASPSSPAAASSPASPTSSPSAEQRRRTADALPDRPAGSTAPAPDASRAPAGHAGEDILAILFAALPDRLEMPSSDHEETEFAYVVVDDGEGKSYVQINVQRDMRHVADHLYGSGAETLPDGTRVATHQGPGEKGGEGVVMWTVDTMRENGLRVVISAFNAGSQSGAATRPEPALSLAELREIALSPQWPALG